MIYICIPVFNRIELTKTCLYSIVQNTDIDFEIIVFDDGSSDDTEAIISVLYPEVTILKGDGTFYWGKSMNFCLDYVFKKARPEDFILMLNNDAVVPQNYLSSLLDVYNEFTQDIIIGSLNLIQDQVNLIENSAFKVNKIPFLNLHKFSAIHSHYKHKNNIESDYLEVDTLAGKGSFISVSNALVLGNIDWHRFRQYHGDTEYYSRAKTIGIPIVLSSRVYLYSYLELTSKTARQNKPGLGTVFKSFFNKKSHNYWRVQYNKYRIHNGRPGSALLLIATLVYKCVPILRRK